jgi:hypothetical protein
MNRAIREYMRRIGAKGGAVSTPAKEAAARENGKLGGRAVRARW